MVDVESFFAASCVFGYLGLSADVECQYAGLLLCAFFAAPAGLPALLHLDLITNILPHEYLSLRHSLHVFRLVYVAFDLIVANLFLIVVHFQELPKLLDRDFAPVIETKPNSFEDAFPLKV